MRPRWPVVLAVLIGAVACIVIFDRAVLHFLGWDGQTSDNYAAWSGSVPAIATILGMSTIVTGLWHAHNCHQDGCWRIGKHKVNGTPFCSRHHEQARPLQTADDLLRDMAAKLDTIAGELRRWRSPAGIGGGPGRV